MNNEFLERHIGLSKKDIDAMLSVIGMHTLDDMVHKILPSNIINLKPLSLALGLSENNLLERAETLSKQNKIFKSFIGQGYYSSITPSVIRRNILENPGWYSAYTPYQAEISQGRLEMLINFQQVIIDLTGMEIANASLLDEASACAEAMMMCLRAGHSQKNKCLLVDKHTHPQNITIIKTRAQPLGIEVILEDINQFNFENCFAVLFSYPNTQGEIFDLTALIKKAKAKKVMSIVASDLLALTLIKTPADMGADVVIGSSQRFGVPMGFGGPHAAFLATKEIYKRMIPGRIIGVSKDVVGNVAFRMALQTREQHIRRDRATSNICTAQVLLAVIAAAYAIYHGPHGLRRIARRVHYHAKTLAKGLSDAQFNVIANNFFDTVTILDVDANKVLDRALKKRINLRAITPSIISIALDEATTNYDVKALLSLFGANMPEVTDEKLAMDKTLVRKNNFLTHAVFNSYHCENEIMRYLKRLESKDIALNHSMIALGSCTMKLNGASEMRTLSLPGFANLHPYAPHEQTKGYQQLFRELERDLLEITGYDKISLQPNAGSQGEFAGLLAIKRYHESKGQGERHICLIPSSAHGTNPASATMAGMHVKVVKCDDKGNVDLEDLRQKLAKYKNELAAIMITYPSTHGVFEEHIKEVCNLVHAHQGQVYLDGANLNAMVGLAKVGEFGADVSHINLHKTFAIPHGGGGPGMGPIGVKAHLAKFLPGNPLDENSYAVSAAHFGSASILPISWAYIQLLGREGLAKSSKVAILSANYIAQQLAEYYPILYTGTCGLVAHECILDLRSIKTESGITEEDIAKRLIDYGFHAPTMSFPVAGTLMVEPTESESKAEIERFICAMRQIHKEIDKVKEGVWEKKNNPLKNAPHTIDDLVNWRYPYTSKEAVYPLETLKNKIYFAPVKRVDNLYGDRNLICHCPNLNS